MPQELSFALLAKIVVSVFLLLFSVASIAFTNQLRPKFSDKFRSSVSAVPKKMQKSLWHNECPVVVNDLVYLKLTYWGFDNKTHMGALIVNKGLAKEIVDIFNVLYLNKFPIQQMVLMDEFNHDDDAAMAANNTSSFNCRAVTGHPGFFSQHSYGRAIDINPLMNPYVKNNKVLPANGRLFVDRNQPSPGKITKDSVIYHEFIKRGWDWGGNWYDVQDYQHFEKRANGERRNPYGYLKPFIE